jgi:hypothetical protein
MDDLAAFIEARLAEDEAMAREATQGDWHWVDPGVKTKLALVTGGYSVDSATRWDSAEWGWNYVLRSLDDRPFQADTAHIARHDPARVLREVAAKRAIVAEHQPRRVGQSLTWCGRCHRVIRDAREDEDPCGPFDWPCPTMRALAAAWNDHGDYRAEWATA